MFFRRVKPHLYSFIERIEGLKKFGFSTEFDDCSKAMARRDGIGAVIEDAPGRGPQVSAAGFVICGEIGALVNGGYQMFWRTPSGKRMPAQAEELKALHAVQEDLKEGLGLTSLYNDGLGTVSELHLYDRVERRDAGDSHKPWEHKPVN